MTINGEKAESIRRNHEQTIVSEVNYCLFTKPPPRPSNYFLGVEEGLAYITDHFQEPKWPRAISTKTTEGRQVVVQNEKEALAWFKAADWLDCRISAYPPRATENHSAIEKFQGVRTVTPSNLIVMMDLDRCNFKSDLALELALSRTLSTIRTKLNANSTVIWSGRGYHVIQVIDASYVNLKSQEVFTRLTAQPSRRFIQFAEEVLSNGKSDKNHNRTVSFGNCMLRVPGSINSKNCQVVILINSWDGQRSRINYLLSDYCVYLANKKAQELRRITGQRRKERQLSYPGFTRNENTGYIIQWIEKLLQIPIADGRKYSVWCILVPYLINCKHIPEEQCSDLIVNWLSRCDKLSRLRFNPNYTITYAIKRVGKYGPIYPDKIRQGFPRFYDLLVEFKII